MSCNFSDSSEMCAENVLVGGGKKRKSIAKASSLIKFSNDKCATKSAPPVSENFTNDDSKKKNTSQTTQNLIKTKLNSSFESLKICEENDCDLNRSFSSLCTTDITFPEYDPINFVETVYDTLESGMIYQSEESNNSSNELLLPTKSGTLKRQNKISRTSKQHVTRAAVHVRKKRMRETDQEKTDRLQKMKDSIRDARYQETDKARAERLKYENASTKRRIANEKSSIKAERLKYENVSTKRRIANETSPERAERLKYANVSTKQLIANETPPERAERLKYENISKKQRITNET